MKIWKLLKEKYVGIKCKCINKEDVVGFDIKYEEYKLPYTISTNKNGIVGLYYSDDSKSVIEIQSNDIMVLDFELIYDEDVLRNNIDKNGVTVHYILNDIVFGKDIYIHGGLSHILYKGAFYELDDYHIIGRQVAMYGVGGPDWYKLNNFKFKEKKGLLVYDYKSSNKSL